MGLFSALNIAVSGLQAQAFALQNISGNIANSQTPGYKGINTLFVDLMPNMPAGTQTSGGVIASSAPTNTIQGQIQASAIGTYMAINGQGFFPVKEGNNSAGGNGPTFPGGDLYTRRGDFQLNAYGYLVNGSGYYLEGIPINPITGNPSGTALAPLQFSNAFLPANPTSTITYGANLPSYPQTTNSDTTVPGSELLDPTDFVDGDPTVSGTGNVMGGVDTTTFMNESIDGGTITCYDGSGAAVNLEFRWAKTDSATLGAGHTDNWELFYQTNSNATTNASVSWVNAGTDFSFDSSGELSPAITSINLTGVSVDGTSLGNLTFSLGGGLTQFSTTSGATTVNSLQQDGYAAGQLQSLSVGSNGRISGSFTNGKTVDLAEIPLFSFASPDSLQSLDGGAFAVTGDSGPALSGASGQLVGASLEGSNADIADQFTQLIVTQQAYSANTRVITTANEMSQDLLNILR
ncbi:MAG TPA: flagellar hook-basal body complex protein [Pseudolabrys sp.]|jgi:flagellar hook protein FlgE|nr:flagellar hook-basal body complex protein [Pseudolabrys sp.]